MINPKNHDVLIVSDGPGKVQVYINGEKLDKVTKVSFHSDMESVPEISLSRLSFKKGGSNEKDA